VGGRRGRKKASSQALLPCVVRIAEEAGREIVKQYRTVLKIKIKSDQSPLTQADLDANRIILEGLGKLTPGVPIISEETPAPAYAVRKKWALYWLVDPLDGTKEFIRGAGEFTVNIALMRKNTPILGVVYAPALGLMYYAERGKGAWRRDGRKRAVRLRIRKRRKDETLRVVVSRSHAARELGNYLKSLTGAKWVSVGSSLKLCYVADGKAHFYPRFAPTMEWDVAAGDCIYRYASDRRSNRSPLKYNKPNLKNGPFLIGSKS